MVFSEFGTIVVEERKQSEEMRDEVILDAFVVMPNHLHGGVCLVPPDVDGITPRRYDLDVGGDPIIPQNASKEDVGPHGDAALRKRKD